MSARRACSSSTGRDSRVRRYESRSPTRSRKRRYSVKQPSAMCCPLSGGGSGSPSRSGSVCTAPPSVGRASYSVTSTPASSSSSAAARPASPPPTTAAFTTGVSAGHVRGQAPLRKTNETHTNTLRSRDEAVAGPGPGRVSSHQSSRDDAELRTRREPTRRVEDVEAVRLHALELAAVEARERRDAQRAAAVERLE